MRNTTAGLKTLKKTSDIFTLVPQLSIIQQFLNALPYYALLLNNNRHILYSNENFLSDNSLTEISQLFGKRPGDIFQCENAVKAGCGKSEHCRYCGIYKTISNCQAMNEPVSNHCRLTVRKGSEMSAYEFIVKASPISTEKGVFYFLTLTDTGPENRKNAIERIFFHDVINIINGLKGLTAIAHDANAQPELAEYLASLSNIADILYEVIQSQRDLSHAENKALTVNRKDVCSMEIVQSVLESSHFYTETMGKTVVLSPESENFLLHTDPLLLGRILTNMVKNALEACSSVSIITIGCSQTNNTAHFYVHNPGYIDTEIQQHIFQRTFSTKGGNRGLGTYSMRLIGENYLEGKVYFESDHTLGTTFNIDLPLAGT